MKSLKQSINESFVNEAILNGPGDITKIPGEIDLSQPYDFTNFIKNQKILSPKTRVTGIYRFTIPKTVEFDFVCVAGGSKSALQIQNIKYLRKPKFNETSFAHGDAHRFYTEYGYGSLNPERSDLHMSLESITGKMIRAAWADKADGVLELDVKVNFNSDIEYIEGSHLFEPSKNIGDFANWVRNGTQPLVAQGTFAARKKELWEVEKKIIKDIGSLQIQLIK